MGSLEQLATEYIDRVVNRRDLTALDDMVAVEYRGSGPGWPTTIEQLRQFYETQARDRPDWHIDVREAVELGNSVVIRAHAYGTVHDSGQARTKSLDWLTHYRFADGRISEINVLEVLHRTD